MSSLPTEILVAPGLGGPTCSTCRNEASPDIPCQCEVTVSVGTPRSTRRLSGCWATTWWLGSKRPRGEREGSKLVPVGFSSRGDFGQYVLDEDNIKVQALRLLSKVSKALGEELVIRLLQLASFRSASAFELDPIHRRRIRPSVDNTRRQNSSNFSGSFIVTRASYGRKVCLYSSSTPRNSRATLAVGEEAAEFSSCPALATHRWPEMCTGARLGTIVTPK